MSKVNDGGPAFPQIILGDPLLQIDAATKQVTVVGSGMTLRDYFAGQALANATFMNFESWEVGNEIDAARVAYLIADGMLKAREA